VSERLIGRPIPRLLADQLLAKSSEIGKTAQPIENRLVALACPSVSLVRGNPQGYNDKFVVEGMFFGAKPPSIYVEFKKILPNGLYSYYYPKCSVVTDESLLYRDAKGKTNASCMKIHEDDSLHRLLPEPVGYSAVTVLYPNVFKNVLPTGFLILDNGYGLATFPLPSDSTGTGGYDSAH